MTATKNDVLTIDTDDLNTHGCADLADLLDAMRAEGLTPEWTDFRQQGRPYPGSPAALRGTKMCGYAAAVIEEHDLGPVAFFFLVDFDTKAATCELGFAPLSMVVHGETDKVNEGWRTIYRRVASRWDASR